ncbi:hypothetical protein ZYGR_0AS06090 [Zygosaccharomyces rouxii]|uniref:Diphthine--ammonia ligase n=1 Tax=Zygosaccharomyces rouxii TaxID=4956 RepID=A0A1Q3AHZ1_ZYGRO|nr:hypothetical protein ZYGR_0AS06090 [Zygosaccharomyces rouxii]
MKFVALISGGKDSCFNIVHCLKQGHELVALANLHPIDKTQQELDSFMFQTVGHDIVPYYAKCTGLPLFRKEIHPFGSKNVELNYTPTVSDEIEDLYDLLSRVVREKPDVKAVSVGAILSSYQRTRVEDVCARLELVVLSYLWQRDQLELMQEMCQASQTDIPGNFEARLIKVAAVGLDRSSLGKTLPEVFPTLMKLHNMYDVHICGEGGEFETMVLDAPFFFKGHLKLLSKEDSPSNGNDGVYNTRLNVEFEERELSKQDFQAHLNALPQPRLLNNKWQELYNHLREDPVIGLNLSTSNNKNKMLYNNSVSKIGHLLTVSNLHSSATTLEEQMQNIFEQLDGILNKYGSTKPSQVLHCTLILSDMSLFPRVNQIYSSYFDVLKNGPLPPARACISSILGDGVLVQLSLLLDVSMDHEKNKNGLHVQGRSYWAPSNIGPYSQAIWLNNDCNKTSYISGQIPLEPATMNLAINDAKLQAVLSLKHFDTLKTTANTSNQLFMTCMLYDSGLISTISSIWSLYCTEMAYESDLWMCKMDDPQEILIIVQVNQLPKNAPCEWSGTACKELVVEDEDQDECTKELKKLSLSDSKEISVKNPKYQRRFITGFAKDVSQLVQTLESFPNSSKVTLYSHPTDITRDFEGTNIEYFPVHNVYDYKGQCHRYGYQAIVWNE